MARRNTTSRPNALTSRVNTLSFFEHNNPMFCLLTGPTSEPFFSRCRLVFVSAFGMCGTAHTDTFTRTLMGR